MLCDSILTNDKLMYQYADFWIECFNLIRRVIGGVDYKGVREIMKVRMLVAHLQPKLQLECNKKKITCCATD